MSKRNLPAAHAVRRADLHTRVAPSALDRWNPGVRAADTRDADNSISIFDVIGQDFWTGDGVTSKRIAAALRAIGERDVVVNINSPGGDYFEGLAIYNLLREHPAAVTVKIVGIAASAASVIAMAGDDIQVARAGFVMIHNTWVVAMGDRHQLREAADWLQPFDETAVDIYAARTGLDTRELGKMLDRETWIGGSDAIDKGFADGLLASDAIVDNPEANAAAQPLAAFHKLDALLARADVPRSERRKLFNEIKGGTPGAAATGTPGAAVTEGLQGLLDQMRSMTA